MEEENTENDTNIEQSIEKKEIIDLEENGSRESILNKKNGPFSLCTVCRREISYDDEDNPLQRHPLLNVLICQNCVGFYHAGNFRRDDDGYEIFCRWCGDGGAVICCSTCNMVFCSECIRKNFGPKKLKEIENDELWSCFKCNLKQLEFLRAICDRFLNSAEILRDNLTSKDNGVQANQDSDNEPLSNLKNNKTRKKNPNQVVSIKPESSKINSSEKTQEKKNQDEENRPSSWDDEPSVSAAKAPKRTRKRKSDLFKHIFPSEHYDLTANKKRKKPIGTEEGKLKRNIAWENKINQDIQQYLQLKEKLAQKKLEENLLNVKNADSGKFNPKLFTHLDYTKTCVAEVKNGTLNQEDFQDVVKGIKLFFNNQQQKFNATGASPKKMLPTRVVVDETHPAGTNVLGHNRMLIHGVGDASKTLTTVLSLPKNVPILPKPQMPIKTVINVPGPNGRVQKMKVISLPSTKRFKINSPKQIKMPAMSDSSGVPNRHFKLVKLPGGHQLNGQKSVMLEMVNPRKKSNIDGSANNGKIINLTAEDVNLTPSPGQAKMNHLAAPGGSATDVFVTTNGMELHKVRLEPQKIPLNIVEVRGDQNQKGSDSTIKQIHISKNQLQQLPKIFKPTPQVKYSYDNVPDLVPFSKKTDNPVDFINNSLNNALNRDAEHDYTFPDYNACMDIPFVDVKSEVLEMPPIEALTPDIDMQELPDIVSFKDNYMSKSHVDLPSKKKYLKYRVMTSNVYDEWGHNLEQLGMQEHTAKTDAEWTDVLKSFRSCIGETIRALTRIQKEFGKTECHDNDDCFEEMPVETVMVDPLDSSQELSDHVNTNEIEEVYLSDPLNLEDEKSKSDINDSSDNLDLDSSERKENNVHNEQNEGTKNKKLKASTNSGFLKVKSLSQLTKF